MIPRIASVPFFKRATDISDCTTAKEAMIKAALDYEVVKVPLIAAKVQVNDGVLTDVLGNTYPSMKDVPVNSRNSYLNNTYAVVRTDNMITLTPPGKTVTGQYVCVQNANAFDLVDNIIETGDMQFQTAACFGRGEEVFVSAKFPNYTKDFNGDTIEDYIVMKLSHDGSGGVVIFMSPIRVVCQNTLHYALRNATNKVMFKHTTNVHSKLKNLDELLSVHVNYSEKLMFDMEVLSRKKVGISDALTFLHDFMLTNADKTAMQVNGLDVKQISPRKANAIEEIMTTIDEGVGQEYHRGTALWMFNGISTYYNNNEFKSNQSKYDSIYNGNTKTKSQVALDYLLATV